MKRLHLVLAATSLVAPVAARAQAWDPDLGNGRYRNPVVYADYSDPDIVRVGGDFYMTASSFGHVPGLPILHSRDLVSWRIVNYAIRRLPSPDFDAPQHGNGVWAPSIRYHAGEFYIYYGDPDRGIYVVKTRDPLGAWDPPVLVRAAKGWIDPAPLWDDDGNAYLVHAFARSRSGIKHVLHVNRMSPDGLRLLDEGTPVFMDSVRHPTMEGPKFYKRGGWYYIFAPAGGVPTGWQTVLRSRSPLGPYEDRIVLAQGTTAVNGPHQGAWVELASGEHWFAHFQDRGPYGRIVHLQPMVWRADGWPVIGRDPDGDGTGEPVAEWAKPNVGRRRRRGERAVPQTSDEFGGTRLGLQWQWQANEQPGWYALGARRGMLRLHALPASSADGNLWTAPNLLLQKLPAPEFTATTRVSLAPGGGAARAGLVVFGLDYAYLALRRTDAGGGASELVQARRAKADGGAGAEEQVVAALPAGAGAVYLRVTVSEGAVCRFAYSLTGKQADFTPIGGAFQAREGRWVGAKLGLFALVPMGAADRGRFADFDFFRIAPAKGAGGVASRR
ncbi:MAG TPA: glycoside hydrolase 43 family protein [Gemmatimonadaceae bacterium]|nr:glycoside hydrolase 43 family protein [Gemmatimonadaceae bacterium]